MDDVEIPESFSDWMYDWYWQKWAAQQQVQWRWIYDAHFGWCIVR
jgi:hypothetical protein